MGNLAYKVHFSQSNSVVIASHFAPNWQQQLPVTNYSLRPVQPVTNRSVAQRMLTLEEEDHILEALRHSTKLIYKF
jgi:hypothetical protein